jgi:nucleoside-diphosphate-sugar epimerase
MLYGPGTWYARDGKYGQAAIAGTLLATNALATFLHVHDAARAAVAALEWAAGIVNVVDDEPAAGAVWVPVFAARLGGPPPQIEDGPPSGRPIANDRAKALGFTLDYPSWRTGFQSL